MLKLVINDQVIEVEEGTTVLQAAQQLQIRIPTLCYHKALSPYGACRLCLVEVSLNGGPFAVQASCTYPAQEGLVVKTDTERVDNARRIMAELLLARCPESEAVKKIAEELGVQRIRIREKNEKCILCGLCVRMCRERMGRGAIGFSHRGSMRKVQPAFDVLSDECQACGACFFVCPTQGIDLGEITKNDPRPLVSDFDCGLRERPAIYIPFPQAVPNCAIIDDEHCVNLRNEGCRVCQEFCEAEAINFEEKEETVELNVGSLILTTGAESFPPELKKEYGYGEYANVVSSIQFERILSASGPYEGHIVRPSDGKVPESIAWIQCVGSRDAKIGKGYCSSVCCMYAIKEAVIAKEHMGDELRKAAIFFMDIRAYGKDFDKYYEKAKNEVGITFIRSRNAEVREDRSTRNLVLKYEHESGELRREEFDLLVLSTGLTPSGDSVDLARRLGITLNKYNFVETGDLNPLETSREGIFVAGTFQGPKDIPETVVQATGAAAMAESLLSDARGTLLEEVTYPPEKDVAGSDPRIGVFVCRCGINIGAYVDVPEVVTYARTLPDVVYAEENLFTCSQDTQQKIKEVIEQYDLNRVVVASCTPRTHEPLFQETLREAGLNPYLFEMANIRDQCSWIHMNEPLEGLEKAKDLVRMACAKVRFSEPLRSIPIDVTQKALVIGGGAAGMVSASRMAEAGYEVYLIEKDTRLGGNANRLYYTIRGEDVQDYIGKLREKLETHPRVHIFLDTIINRIDGYVGNYTTTITVGEEMEEAIDHGVIIVAVGAEEEVTGKYFHGKDERVVTNLELEEMIGKNEYPDLDGKRVVFIQCVGSRSVEHPYCSRVCCGQSIKNALRIRDRFAGADIVICYRDMRTYGFKEEYYEEARAKGILFVRYDQADMPEAIMSNDDIYLVTRDQTIGEDIIFKADLVVITPCIVPRRESSELAKMLKVPLNEDGFFLEAHVKLRPVDFATEGVFVVGMAHNPKYMDETIAQANAAVSRACTILSSDKYYAEAAVAMVNDDVCDGCGICEPVCEYGAIEIVTEEENGKELKKAKLTEALCKGCGTCIAACPSGALEQKGFKSEQLVAMVDAALE